MNYFKFIFTFTMSFLFACQEAELPKGADIDPAYISKCETSPERIKLYFSETLKASSVNSNSVLVKNLYSEIITGDVTYDINEKTVTFKPQENFKFETQYTVQAMKEIKDNNGNSMTQPYKKDFSFFRPAITYVLANDLSSITMKISKLLDEKTITNSSITVVNTLTGEMVPGRVEFNTNVYYLSFIPDEDFIINIKYQFHINNKIKCFEGFKINSMYNENSDGVEYRVDDPDIILPDITNIITYQSHLEIKFSEDIDIRKIGDQAIKIEYLSNYVGGDVTYDSEKRAIIFRPHVLLDYTKAYNLLVDKKYIYDYAGNQMQESYTTSFVPTQTEFPDPLPFVGDAEIYVETLGANKTKEFTFTVNKEFDGYVKAEFIEEPNTVSVGDYTFINYELNFIMSGVPSIRDSKEILFTAPAHVYPGNIITFYPGTYSLLVETGKQSPGTHAIKINCLYSSGPDLGSLISK